MTRIENDDTTRIDRRNNKRKTVRKWVEMRRAIDFMAQIERITMRKTCSKMRVFE